MSKPPPGVPQSVWDDAETCSMEELEAAADLYDRLVAEAGKRTEKGDTPCS